MSAPVPLLAGILNVTPDSFSDGGRFAATEAAVARGLAMQAAGAHWVDVGGESTRPGADPVPPAEEIRRVVPVVAALAEAGVRVSIDTRRAEVAREALAAGAVVVNDVAGLTAPGMVEVVAEAGAGAVVMHMRGDPRTMQRDTRYGDVVDEVRVFLAERIERAREAGITELWADPGIGFGKSGDQCAELVRRLPELGSLGVPLYVGASRKSFLGRITGVTEAAARLPESLGVAAAAALAGAAVLRVHDVGETRRMLAVLTRCLPAS